MIIHNLTRFHPEDPLLHVVSDLPRLRKPDTQTSAADIVVPFDPRERSDTLPWVQQQRTFTSHTNPAYVACGPRHLVPDNPTPLELPRAMGQGSPIDKIKRRGADLRSAVPSPRWMFSHREK